MLDMVYREIDILDTWRRHATETISISLAFMREIYCSPVETLILVLYWGVLMGFFAWEICWTNTRVKD